MIDINNIDEVMEEIDRILERTDIEGCCIHCGEHITECECHNCDNDCDCCIE